MKGVLAAKIFDPLSVDVQQPRRGCLVALGAAKRGGGQGDLHLLHGRIEVSSGVGQQDRFVGGKMIHQKLRGEVSGLDLIASNGDDQPLKQIFQLPDVARPAMLLQGGKSQVVEVLRWDVVGDAVGVEKKWEQSRGMSP
jgi:hypothetical protein